MKCIKCNEEYGDFNPICPYCGNDQVTIEEVVSDSSDPECPKGFVFGEDYEDTYLYLKCAGCGVWRECMLEYTKAQRLK